MRRPRHTGRLAALAAAALIAAAGGAAGAAPQRVVSTNLCTDQLAMMLAGEGQLHSVSYLARDRRSSAMPDAAARYPVNHGLAEEIYMMRPDLVIAGPMTRAPTLAMLRRLGIRVETFAPAESLGDVRAHILRMGELLGRQDAARAMVADFDTRLAALQDEVAERPGAVLYYANGYTPGDRSLAGRILLAAGFENAAAAHGYAAGATIPLEVLAMIAPDIAVTSQTYPGASRAEDIMDHPVVRAFRTLRATSAMTDHDWVCGTPYVLRAIESLAADRRALAGEGR